MRRAAIRPPPPGATEASETHARPGDGSFVARNGTVIEQSQVLTTHNLAPLVGGLGLADRLQP